MIQVILRTPTSNDTNFIYNSFLKSFKSSYPITFCPANVYYPSQSKVIEFLLSHSRCLIAVIPEDPDAIVGWVIYDEPNPLLVIHFIYVKSLFRHKKVGKSILKSIHPNVENDVIVATHCGLDFAKLRHKQRMIYDPYYIINKMIMDNK